MPTIVDGRSCSWIFAIWISVMQSLQGTRRTKRERRFLGDFTGDLAEMGDPAENSRKWGPLSPLRELTEGQWKALQRQLR